ncbi:type VI secretion system protein TssA [Pseudomonas putida]|uniref:type VI secretion system protein TssA n=1 Tax=Pseudomonas putida TaxID=303 RepID=UPI00236465DD|nr:type VI secretion system protein TssA [Pseudomonas putida]MDD1969158.1 type VI secretion system protein TssA [Pseudomonas putida]
MQTVDYFLEPVNVLQHAGKDLTYSVEFDDIKKLRSSDDPTLDQGEWVTDLKVANWPEVIKRCSELLKSTTKDLRLVIWMTEAMVHTKGFAGLADGYSLFASLCDRYWDTIHPQPEEGDQEQRVGTLSWLLAHSVVWLTLIDVVDDGQSKYTLGDYAAARSRSGVNRSGESSSVTLEQLDRARAATPVAFYEKLWQDAGAAMAALESLQACAQELLGEQSPGFSAVFEAFGGVVGTIQRFAKDAGVSMPSQVTHAVEVDASSGSADVAPPSGAVIGSITSRTEALAMLRQVAEYFRQAEPHSPAAYLADQAAKWGGMTLHEWLPLVLRDEGALGRLQELLGVSATSQP